MSSSPNSKGSVPSLGPGVAAMKLDVTRLDSAEQKPTAAPADNNIALLLELPDGKTELLKYRPDLTVGYVKVEVAKKHGIPFDCQELELAGKPLADPFSLLDYPALKASRADNPVRVVLKRVQPSDGEEEEDHDAAAATNTKDDGNASDDYDDESFED